MPAERFFGDKLLAAVQSGEVSESRIDDMLVRRYREMIRFGLFEREPGTTPIPAEEHAAIAREIGVAGTILLRNEEGALPLDASEVTVTNTGVRAGAEVVQVYVAYPPALGEPPKQLRAFARVELSSGESRRVRLPLGERAFALWNTDAHEWAVQPGAYGILVGSSSANTPLQASLTVR